MSLFRLVDADFIINLVRTLTLINEQGFEDEITEKLIFNEKFSLISTPEVKNEVSEVLFRESPRKDFDGYFLRKQKELKQINKKVMANIRILPIDKNCRLTQLLSSTSLKNMGEKSLVILLFCKYNSMLQNNNDRIQIVSNNQKDVLALLKKANKLIGRPDQYIDEETLIQTNFEFYYELFTRLKIQKDLIYYFYFVSNIDARYYDKEMIEIFQKIRQYR